MPDSIMRIKDIIPDKVDEFAARYKFEDIEKYIRYAMKKYEIYENRAVYAECFSNAALCYYYSICRCAFCDYSYVVPYIRKMIEIAIICGLNMSDEVALICKENNLRAVSCEDKGI